MVRAVLSLQPVPIRWLVSEFHDMYSLGIFRGQHCMLINGLIFEQHHGDPVDPDPRRVRYTRDQYRALAEHGFFQGRRVLLLNGEILQMAAMKEPHAASSSLVVYALQAAFGPGFWVREQKPLDVNTSNDPEPDVVVVPGNPRTYSSSPTAPHASVALVVVEVADSTLPLDTSTKPELYATAGVLDYWVVDVINNVLLVFRDPYTLPGGTKTFRTVTTLTVGDTVTVLAVPNVPIPVADLLP
jgi:Uma2 family endonuclease